LLQWQYNVYYLPGSSFLDGGVEVQLFGSPLFHIF
jgi:hypothetical protein